MTLINRQKVRLGIIQNLLMWFTGFKNTKGFGHNNMRKLFIDIP